MVTGATVQVDRIVKQYGELKVVDDVSFEISPGEFFTILGSSGSGKTTTLMMMAGFINNDAGAIRINNSDITRLPPERRNLGVVFQSYALFPHLNVFDNIAFPLRLRKEAPEAISRRVNEMLNLVGLEPYRSRAVAQLSGGQQQRVALARAIAFSPPILLMDEPMGALDRQLREQLQGEIKRIQRELGVTVVYVTHDQEEALALSDRIMIMQHGRVIQVGTPDHVYECPNSSYVANFLGESNNIQGAARILSGEQVTLVSDIGYSFKGRLVNGESAPSPGDAVHTVVRPEAVTISGEMEKLGDNVLSGRISLREFLGATIRYVVDTPIGKLIIRTSRLSSMSNFELDAEVQVCWKPEDMLVFSGLHKQ